MTRRIFAFALFVAAGCSAPNSDRGAAKSAISPASFMALGKTSFHKCDAATTARIFVSPRQPWLGSPLRALVVSDRLLDGELTITDSDGKSLASTSERKGGPPYHWEAEVESPAEGDYGVTFKQPTCEVSKAIAKVVSVRKARPWIAPATWSAAWPVQLNWNQSYEDFYSAWIERLFDAPLSQTISYAALHEVLRDKKRNFLHDYLGADEDQSGDRALVIRPDCADFPYFLRAYFSFKMGLPFGFSRCNRGGGGAAPTCGEFFTNDEPVAAKRPGLVASFGHFVRWTLADAVHSGSARPLASDDNSDYYSVPLTYEELRPGTIYADPYGHVLVVVSRVAQTESSAGVLLAVDGQPDGTIARKRFWRGNFLFASDPALGTPGFKRFRPVIRTRDGWGRMTNSQITQSRDYGDFSSEQAKLGVEDFYDRMDDVMSPSPLDPMRAMKEAIIALDEQVRARVTSIENGRKFIDSGKGTAEMPEGDEIFETNGAWEDFSTPSRDLRLLIAIDVVRGFPERVDRRPNRYRMPDAQTLPALRAELERVLAAELSSRKFAYTRSDGSSFELTLDEVVRRAPAFEMAYNPNECVELRWGAAAGSAEAATCRAHAPAEQRNKMETMRPWFRDRRRPPRQ